MLRWVFWTRKNLKLPGPKSSSPVKTATKHSVIRLLIIVHPLIVTSSPPYIMALPPANDYLEDLARQATVSSKILFDNLAFISVVTPDFGAFQAPSYRCVASHVL